MTFKLPTEVVRQGVLETTGIFTYKDLFTEKGINDPLNQDYARTVMNRLCKEKIIRAIDGRHGTFKLIDRDAPVLNWKGVNNVGGFDISWPFELEKYVKVFRRNIIVIGKVWNAGGSAFVYNIIDLNWQKHKIILFDSENSEQELKLRFSKFANYESWPADMVRERTKDFCDVIEPDSINIIDHLEIVENAYLVGRYIREIHDVLNQGIAIVLLQKGKFAKLPIGGDFGLRLPRLVLSIDKGLLTVVKAKTWVDRTVNPNDKSWSFQLVDGAHFVNTLEVKY